MVQGMSITLEDIASRYAGLNADPFSKAVLMALQVVLRTQQAAVCLDNGLDAEVLPSEWDAVGSNVTRSVFVRALNNTSPSAASSAGPPGTASSPTSQSIWEVKFVPMAGCSRLCILMAPITSSVYTPGSLCVATVTVPSSPTAEFEATIANAVRAAVSPALSSATWTAAPDANQSAGGGGASPFAGLQPRGFVPAPLPPDNRGFRPGDPDLVPGAPWGSGIPRGGGFGGNGGMWVGPDSALFWPSRGVPHHPGGGFLPGARFDPPFPPGLGPHSGTPPFGGMFGPGPGNVFPGEPDPDHLRPINNNALPPHMQQGSSQSGSVARSGFNYGW